MLRCTVSLALYIITSVNFFFEVDYIHYLVDPSGCFLFLFHALFDCKSCNVKTMLTIKHLPQQNLLRDTLLVLLRCKFQNFLLFHTTWLDTMMHQLNFSTVIHFNVFFNWSHPIHPYEWNIKSYIQMDDMIEPFSAYLEKGWKMSSVFLRRHDFA